MERRPTVGNDVHLTNAGLAWLTFPETFAFLLAVALPTWLKGVLIRRRFAVALAAKLDLDRNAVRHIARLRARRGSGPLAMALPGRLQALVLDPDDVRRVLDETPDPFSAASGEKRAALSHFEPDNVLISQGDARTARRRRHDQALESGCPIHSLSSSFAPRVDAAAGDLVDAGLTDWPSFSDRWMRLVRELVLGEQAADDTRLADQLNALRRSANWAFAMPKRKRLRAAFHARLQAHVDRATAATLAGRLAGAGGDIDPADQVAQWLFAFDPVGIATFRALAAITAHPEAMARARSETALPLGQHDYLRACVVESVRLWPTTPAILRQTTRPTSWRGGALPEGTGLLIFTPFLNRDPERLAVADSFTPELWLGADPAENGALTPFSAGPAKCPARHLAPMLGAGLIAALLRRGTIVQRRGQVMSPEHALPATLDHFALAFQFRSHAAPSEAR
jgi:cytochrome P450